MPANGRWDLIRRLKVKPQMTLSFWISRCNFELFVHKEKYANFRTSPKTHAHFNTP